jgi:hypothetical protein
MGRRLPSTAVAVRLLLLAASPALSLCPLRAEASKFALVLGINSPADAPQDQRLRYADSDATEFAALLKTPEGGNFPPNNVVLLVNQHAGRQSIYRAITELGKRVSHEDTVYVFFAGHGVRDPFDRAYFLPYDAALAEPEPMGIRANDFIRDIRLQVNPKHLVFFIDACYAGAAYSEGVARTPPQNITDDILKAWKDQPSTDLAFLSASGVQRSWEDPDLGHGIFTHFLIRGIRGEADAPPYGDEDGKVTAGELQQFLFDKIRSHSRTKFTEQTPVTSPSFDSGFPLSLMAWRRAPAVQEALARPTSDIIINIVPTQASQLLDDPAMRAVHDDLLKLGYKLIGWPAHTGYSLTFPNGSRIQWGAHCVAGVTYFDSQLKARAAEVRAMVVRHSTVGGVHFQDVESLPDSGVYRWLKEIVRRGQVHMEVCFGFP